MPVKYHNPSNLALIAKELPYGLGTAYYAPTETGAFTTAETLAAFIKLYQPLRSKKPCILEAIEDGTLQHSGVVPTGYRGRIVLHHALNPEQTEAAIRYAGVQRKYIHRVFATFDMFTKDSEREMFDCFDMDMDAFLRGQSVFIRGKPTQAAQWLERKNARKEAVRIEEASLRSDGGTEAASNVVYLSDYRK